MSENKWLVFGLFLLVALDVQRCASPVGAQADAGQMMRLVRAVERIADNTGRCR